MIKRVSKFILAFALFSSAMIYSQGEITALGGTFNESVPAGTTDFSSLLMRARMSGNTTLNFTSSDPAAIQAIQQQAAQMGITVNIISPNETVTPSAPAMDQIPVYTSMPSSEVTAVPQPNNLDQDRQSVIDRINGFRQTKGLPPLQRWLDGEACADNQAKNDALSGAMHKNYGSCQESAQMTCPGWDSIESIVSGCLQQMWDEGPGTGMEHIHYTIMSSDKYSQAAVGIYQMSNGKFWVDINLR